MNFAFIDTPSWRRYTHPMFGISGEHLVILAVILLFLGPKRLPELSNALGKALKNFKDSMAGVEEPSYRKIENTEAPPAPGAQAQNGQQTSDAKSPSEKSSS